MLFACSLKTNPPQSKNALTLLHWLLDGKMESVDRVFQTDHRRVGDFQFDDEVARVFPNMISRSVPGYGSILSMIEQLAERFVVTNSHVYDLGCSLGAATLLMRPRLPGDCKIYAIDNSTAMVSRLREKLTSVDSNGGGARVEILETDMRDVQFSNASFVVLNFTLQFLPVAQRRDVLQRVYQGMLPGGALLVSEKLRFAQPEQQDWLTNLHLDFKRANGYSEMEIAQKRTALEQQLVPETMGEHIERLEAIGFSTIVPWFQCFNFASMLAVKSET